MLTNLPTWSNILKMAKVVNLQKYKTSKALIKELTLLSNDYEYILKALNTIQHGLGKWSKYRSPIMTSYKIEEVKIYIQHEMLRLRAVVKLEKGLIGE